MPASRAEKGRICPPPLSLRAPEPGDEEAALQAQDELAADGFDFLLLGDRTWAQWLDKVARDRAGVDLAPGRVPATMLFGVVGEEIVGRAHIRHELTPALLEEGGHIGYGVRPDYRRRGYATAMLRQGLQVVRGLGVDRALVTCDDDNPASIATIERCGGVLEDTRPRDDGASTRRYWIDLS
ncbi:GNAT family N-acetyltransferase [Ornithinimicrobium sp. F0845]|uniref:GNAT family N-acetyltransferase n=1 Tax=Ornithinimicrobium sp. F0845 TaxID=2926412 RepID=UPI001FF5BEC1|nr:GNAT family N-acetyltransferase [Ornithinimicrobium sp. F0845]MCK0110865.1 GNAT family N-acetyltransferase [Ornithinimicrobium sp. F0845]